jgi:poly(3-hydroxybutyrate) depolymerase
MPLRSLLFGLAALLAAVPPAGARTADKPRTGDFKDDYKDKSGALIMHYRMMAPEKLPEEKVLGLIVWFHGMGGNEDGAGIAIDSTRRAKLADQYVVMGGKSKGQGWAPADDENVLKWIAWAKETYPVDPRRVHIMGHSNGGGMVKRFGWDHQDLFASISPYAGAGGGRDFGGTAKGQTKPGKPGAPDSPAETKTEWYFVHGDKDEAVNVSTSRNCIKELKEKGYRTVYREIAGADHGSIFQFNDVLEDNIRFIHALRHKEMTLSKAETTKLKELVTKAKTEKADGIAPILAEASRFGGAPGGHVAVAALESPDPEVKKAAAETAEVTLYGKDVVMALIKALKDKNDDVKPPLYKALGVAANWRYPEAQDALIAVARNKKAPVPERVATIESLGKAIKLQLLGAFEDKMMIWTLVLLLDDDDEKVQEAAFAQLEKPAKQSFDYKPGLSAAERKAVVAKWKSWATDKCGPLEGPAARKS